MEQGHGFCRVGGWGGSRWLGSLGRRWHLSKVSWEVEEYRSGSRGNSPPGPKRQPDVPVGKVGGGGGLASLILVCGIGLGWEVCVCVYVCVCVCVCVWKNMRESWLYWGSRGVLSARACGFVPCSVCVRVCAH